MATLTTHEVIDHGVYRAVEVAEPVGQLGYCHCYIWRRDAHCISAHTETYTLSICEVEPEAVNRFVTVRTNSVPLRYAAD